jgi:hypothetical protein
MQVIRYTYVAFALAVVGCQASTTPHDGSIAKFVFDETDGRLVATGIGRDGTPVGSITITYGRFMDPDLKREVDGREVVVLVDGRRYVHVSEGREELQLPAIEGSEHPGTAELLLDRRLEAPLRRYGVTLEPREPTATAETPFHSCTYQLGPNCGSNDCYQRSVGAEKEQSVCCWGGMMAVIRRCTTPFGQTVCGQAGENGCRVCWQWSFENTCVVEAWDPHEINSDWCGDGYCTEYESEWCYQDCDQ